MENSMPQSEDTKRPPHGVAFTLPQRLFGPDSASNKRLLLHCIDCHAGGEPARVVLSGVPNTVFPPDCTTALLKRNYMMEHMDYLRKILLLEPRGYPCQNVNFVFSSPPSNDCENNTKPTLQYVIGEQNKIYPLMSGHNTICVATALVECGVIGNTMADDIHTNSEGAATPTKQFTLESPAGPIGITAKLCSKTKKVTSIVLRNAPSFCELLDVTVQVPHIGPVVVDIAYGGMWYAVVDVQQFASANDPALGREKMRLEQENASELCRVGEMIKVACREQFPVQHPTQDYPGVDILAFRGPASPRSGAHSRNAVVMSNNVLDWNKPETFTAMLDRSPCGTGTCAIMAVMHRRGLLKLGEPFVHESIIGSIFTGTILEETTIANGKLAIIPQIEGSAYITQYSQVVVDPHDPFPEGYRVADIW